MKEITEASASVRLLLATAVMLGNNCKVSFATNVLALHVTQVTEEVSSENELFAAFIEQEINKLLRRINMFPLFI